MAMSVKRLNVKGWLSLLGGLALIALGIWMTQDQAAREQQWNLEREAASSSVPGEHRREASETSAMTGTPGDDDPEGLAEALP